MTGKSKGRGSIRARFGNGLLLLCLFVPSAWTIATIPPLWRDADAYVQLTESPLVATFWGHAPAYCYVAKVPLLAGEQLERWRGHAPVRHATELSQPALTDSGIWLLIIGQHLALGIAAFCFIRAVCQLLWVRLILALAWASNALFYTFAHCVGSETLGMIFIVFLAVQALRLTQGRDQSRWQDWYIFGLLLLFSFLSRDLNLGLIALLPAAFLLSWAQHRTAGRLAPGDEVRLRLRRLAAQDFRSAVIAIAIGVACMAIAHSTVQGLARKSRFHPHSRIGFTFLWRLHFLSDLSPESRRALLQKASARAPSETVRNLIALLEQMHTERADLVNTGPFMQRAVKLFAGSFRWEELDLALNQMAFTFLWPPAPELLNAIRTDFVPTLKLPSTIISEYLFATTSYYFQHKDEMPACAGLVTFRGDGNADEIEKLPFQHRYFRLWQGVSYNQALMIWFTSLLAFLITARQRRASLTPIAFGVALTASGLLIFAASCVLHEYEPRFGLSMWQLLLLSLLLFIGKTADLLASRQGAADEQA